ncbi:hypothetical protein FJR45_00395 [Sulfurimonas sediminis]|uniref:DUF4282 domain-containing protein n=1 Tax=Sulfurimonas sediminis TaxID=2590020 RepID=A0A7M1AYR0_9BACT|nr:hypothetical protein [Sulfurimonas sediminis]QOP42495.1 hypothetical protein FJR45_00395 [Sulfurimonas sediminis]
MLDFIERNYLLVSYFVGFFIWVIDIKIMSTDFLIFLALSPLLATLTGSIALLAMLLAFFPIIYGYELFKMIFCNSSKRF